MSEAEQTASQTLLDCGMANMFIKQRKSVSLPSCRLPTNHHLKKKKNKTLSTELTYFPRPNIHYSFITELDWIKILKGDKQLLHHC